MSKRLNRPEEELVKQYFPGFMIFRLNRARNTTTKGQDEKKDVLLWQEEKTYNKESIHSKRTRSYNLQIKT
jgi:hypothetical protein